MEIEEATSLCFFFRTVADEKERVLLHEGMFMVTAGKVFKVAELALLSDIASKLKGFKTEEEYEEGDYKFTLVTEVMNLTVRENTVAGVYSHDYMLHIFHRGKVVPLPKTIEAMFNFAQFKKQLFLTVVEKKRVANPMANKLSEIIF